MAGSHHRIERCGFSMTHLMPSSVHLLMSLWVKSTRSLAARTRSRSFPVRPGRPPGHVSDLSGCGSGTPWAFRYAGMGLSRAREKVPQGMPNHRMKAEPAASPRSWRN
eukprot:14397352-Heterocapsa_arctica.AAC.2